MTEPRDLPAPEGAALDLPAPDGAPLDLPGPEGAALDLPDPDGPPAAADFPAPDLTGATPVLDAAAVPDVTTGGGNPGPAPDVDPTVTSGPGTPTQAPPTPDGGRAARRRATEEAAREQADVSRRRALIAAGVAVALLVAFVGGWFLLGRGSSDDAGASPTASPSASGPKQPTLLVQVTDKEGIGVGNALLSIGGSGSLANMLTVSPDTIVDPATGGTMPFGEVDRLPDADAAANALSDAIGVTVNGTWTMDKLAFSGLVDAVGGVVMDVNADVIDSTGGTQSVIVGSGQHQLLQGPQAAAYATFLAPGETEAARTARFVEVFRLAIAKLPTDATKAEAIITGLGASARSTESSRDLSTFLVKLHEYVLADNVAYNALPTVPNDAGGATAGQRIDTVAAADMVDKYFADAQRTPGPNSKTRVLVQNGVGTPGLNTGARDLLVEAGYSFVNGGNASVRGLSASQVIVQDRSPEQLKLGADIATALKLPPTAVVVAAEGQSIADVVVVLGRDFAPPAAG
ncbi:MAG TPA: LytR C-terminal domain-containing protein [Candidatus Nanopelagicales bacterium]|nr:LytR C-terminal domain-containing protein [Candidatus Nanopelagicales bacterium]